MTHSSPSSGFSSEVLSQQMQALDSFSTAMMWLDEQGTILGVNARFARILNQQKENFAQKNIFQFAPTITFIDWKGLWKQLLTEKQMKLNINSGSEEDSNKLLELIGVSVETGKQTVCCAMLAPLPANPLAHQQLEALFQLNKIGNWEWNLRTNQFILSESACQLLEIDGTDKEFEHKRLHQILKDRLYPKEYARLRQQLKDALLHGNQVDVEFSMQVPSLDKEERFRCLAFIAQEAGRTVHMWGTVQNITEIVDRTEEMYLTHYCLDNVREIVYWVDVHGDLKYVNAEMCNMLGYTRAELLQMKLKELRPDFNETRWNYQWEEFRNGKILELEVNFKNKDNQEIPVLITGYYIKFRGQEVACIFGKDLRFEKRREEMLRLTRFSLNNTQEMVYWLRQDGSFYYFNNAFANRLGYNREEVQRMKLLDFFPSFNQEGFEYGWQRLRSGEIISQEMQIMHRNGFYIPVQAYVTQIEVEGETCACGILSDISERKRKEEELKDVFTAIKQLQEQYEVDNKILKEELAEEYHFNNIISTSAAYKKVLKQVERASQTDATVLLIGEMGTGKELLAHALHRLSRRASRPLATVNTTMIPEHLLESELFGHEQGAFPGAFQQKKGRFELANGGAIFFNEIADLSLRLQEKLLDVLQNGELTRMGGTEPIQVNVRVIAATNRNLEELVASGLFRSDLYLRLGLLTIFNIPLRERREDIPLLVRFFVEKISHKAGKRITNIPKKVINDLMQYDFPGNVRELENIIERAIILSKDETLQCIISDFTSLPLTKTAFKSLEEVQRDHILTALRLTKGQITGENGAAKLLKMNDQTLYSKMKKLKVQRRDYLL